VEFHQSPGQLNESLAGRCEQQTVGRSTNTKQKKIMMNAPKTEAIDPICGMTVDTSTAIHAERDGEISYFCSDHCRQKFVTAANDAKTKGKSGGCCG
jgi:YHS domain-containing protein